VVEADLEEGFGVIAVAFSCRSLLSKLVSSGSTGPGDGQGRKRHEQAKLARISKARVLYVGAGRTKGARPAQRASTMSPGSGYLSTTRAPRWR